MLAARHEENKWPTNHDPEPAEDSDYEGCPDSGWTEETMEQMSLAYDRSEFDEFVGPLEMYF